MEGKKTLTPMQLLNKKLKTLSIEDFYIWVSSDIDYMIQKEKEVIIEAANYSTKKNKKLLESKGILTSDKIGENYYNTKYNNNGK